ncbi:hypothetical protein AMS68_001360 [Peltaster fructicola]|uniref:Ubiquitin carboxyl-terminal hydrolase n=1 Tax=Peltaster fructicola TaxID=286661 RepID=A0A6H0XMA0_9PEZI|nr:hypothetical protein AMS68_001360 [Peltaster fructicola]
MSFFGKFKPSAAGNTSTLNSVSKKDPNASQLTPLEKHIADITEPVRVDGSDKFFGFENYGSTCYCNSIVQCLYYSAPFRESVINYPTKDFLESLKSKTTAKERDDGLHSANGAPLSPRATATATPYPNPTSPARKALAITSTFPGSQPKPEENKDTPEYKKKMAIQAGPVLDMTKDNSKEYGMDESLFTSLKDIFEAIIAHKSRTGVVSPHKFLEILRRENEMFRSAMHQDAHEFLNLLLNSVVENVEQFSKLNPPPESRANGTIEHGSFDKALSKVISTGTNADPRWVHDIFEGVLTSETRCLTCETVSQRDEAFLDLSVDLSPHTSVTSCLRKFSQEEMLCERNKFHCDPCGGLQEAEKRMKIKRLPKILALHLKRFKYTEDLQKLQKLFHRVVYPFHLRLFNTTDDAEDADRLYELYAVVVHIGGGPYHGHYVSIVKTQDRGWLLFDDELVEPVSKDYVLSFFGGEPIPGASDARQLACAYVLFYQQTTLEAVLKEQEMESHPETILPVTVAESAQPVQNKETSKVDAYNLLGLVTPTSEEPHYMDSLAHSVTAPPTLLSPVLSLDASKSKKELKQDEKERKAAQKAEEKILIQKRREASDKRIEVMRRQDEHVKLAMEASKQSAAEEAKARGEDVHTAERSAFSRFTRTSSLHLRSRPKLFGGNHNKDKESLPVLSPVTVHNTPHDESALTALPTPPPFSPIIEESNGKEKKNRFSLGRKRSTQVL